jgi:formate hydrogenlyase transcriptional activator
MDNAQLEPSKGSSQALGDEMSPPKQDPAGRTAQPVETRESLENRLEFESLLAELSARFVNLPSDQIDSAIEDAERRICEFLDLDQAALWQRRDKIQGDLALTHLFNAHGIIQPPERMDVSFFPWYRQEMLAGRTVAISTLDELPEEAAVDRESGHRFGIKSNLTIPLSVGGGLTIGVLGLSSMRGERQWPNELVKRLELVALVFANALARKRADQERQGIEAQLRERLREIEELKQRLESENVYLQDEIGLLIEHEDIVGRSAAIKDVLVSAEQVARTESTVLLMGETGTGKELLARAIHRMSRRKDRTLVTINCASLPATLIESELFGREKGAYTDALTRMAGRFEVADGSTLFLDEIGELPFEVQSKLLRVLEEGQFERLGSTKTLKADVRIIAATNRDLERAVNEGKFRKDLFYRLSVFPIVIPPLRDRSEDIPLLVWTFVNEFEKKMGKRIDRIARGSMESLQRYSWPGNIRELRNMVEHGIIVSTGSTLTVHLPLAETYAEPDSEELASIERSHLLKVLAKSRWQIGGKGGAAMTLGLKRTTLLALMKRLGIKPPARKVST